MERALKGKKERERERGREIRIIMIVEMNLNSRTLKKHTLEIMSMARKLRVEMPARK